MTYAALTKFLFQAKMASIRVADLYDAVTLVGSTIICVKLSEVQKLRRACDTEQCLKVGRGFGDGHTGTRGHGDIFIFHFYI